MTNLKFSVNKLLQFRHISKINTCIALGMWQLELFICHIYTYIHIRAHTQAHTHAHTDTQTHPRTLTQIKILQFFGKKFKFFSENIRSNKDSGQIEKNELTS